MVGVAVGALFLALGLMEVAVGWYRIVSREPGLTGLPPGWKRTLAWMLSGTDVRADGTPSRFSLGDTLGGGVQVVIGLVMVVLAVSLAVAR